MDRLNASIDVTEGLNGWYTVELQKRKSAKKKRHKMIGLFLKVLRFGLIWGAILVRLQLHRILQLSN